MAWTLKESIVIFLQDVQYDKMNAKRTDQVS